MCTYFIYVHIVFPFRYGKRKLNDRREGEREGGEGKERGRMGGGGCQEPQGMERGERESAIGITVPLLSPRRLVDCFFF